MELLVLYEIYAKSDLLWKIIRSLMSDQNQNIREIVAEMDRLISEEYYSEALNYVEDTVIPILPIQVGSSQLPSKHYDLILPVSNIYYLNQQYDKAKNYLSIVKDTDCANNSHDFVILWALLLTEEGEYSSARKYLRSRKVESWSIIQNLTVDYHIGINFFWEGNYKEATTCFQKCITNDQSRDGSPLFGWAQYMLGYISFNRCFFKLAEAYYLRALREFEFSGKHNQIGKTYKQLGILYYRIGKYPDSKIFIELSIKHFRECSNQVELLKAHIALARIYMFTNENLQAIEHLKDVYGGANELGLKREIALTSEFLGEVYANRGDHIHALRYLKEAAQIAVQIAPYGDISVEVYRRLGEVYLGQGKIDVAERMTLKGIEIAEELEDKYELGSLLRVYALINLKKGEIDLTQSYFSEAIVTLKLIRESFELAKTYRMAAESYENILKSKQCLPEAAIDMLTEARDYSIEAMHLYAMLGLDRSAEECKKLFDRIEEYSHVSDLNIQPESIEFKDKWIYESSVVGRSGNIDVAVQKARLIAPSDIRVLVFGETGTGKELIARLLHKLSLRSKGPFIPINCASIPETVFESELFGHRKGSFTGALRDKPGLMEAANGGTLFLDEISELSNQQQAKLLRALQEGKIRRVGETTERFIDVRVVSASNEDVKTLVESGTLRKDFYYRICVETIELEPLRKRKEDIFPLFTYYLDGDRNDFKVEEGVFELLGSYHWPGNVRELVGIVKILKLVSEESGVIRICDLPLKIRDASSSEHIHLGGRPKKRVTPPVIAEISGKDNDLLKSLIVSCLSEHKGNKSAVARDLGLSRSTLYRRMEELHIEE